MKKVLIYLLIAAALGGAAWYLTQNQSQSTVQKQLTDFAFSDTASITRIFLADKNNKSLTLDRTEEGHWMINQENVARQDMVDNLLRTIKLLRVRTPVPKSMHNNVIRQLAGNSVKVEIYQNGETTPAKVYFVGGPNQDHTGSFMLLENSSVPFVMHIEGHYGYLSSRYSTNKYMWRDNFIWQFPGEKITTIDQIQITNHRNPRESFQVKKLSDTEYQILDANGSPKNANMGKVLTYVKQYESIAFEGYEETKNQAYMDSVMKAIEPWHTIQLTTVDGEKSSVTTWPKPMSKPATDLLTGDTIVYDMDRLYALVNEDKMVIGQHLTFGRLTIDAKFFDN